MIVLMLAIVGVLLAMGVSAERRRAKGRRRRKEFERALRGVFERGES